MKPQEEINTVKNNIKKEVNTIKGYINQYFSSELKADNSLIGGMRRKQLEKRILEWAGENTENTEE